MNKNVIAGLLTMIGWNLFIVILVVLAAPYKGGSYWFLFNDGTNGIGMSLFLILWSIIWFAIGHHVRKDYYAQLETYKKSYPSIDSETLQKEYNNQYKSKAAKLILRLLVVAIPWYVLGRYVEDELGRTDLIVIFSLMLLSAFTFRYYKRNTTF